MNFREKMNDMLMNFKFTDGFKFQRLAIVFVFSLFNKLYIHTRVKMEVDFDLWLHKNVSNSSYKKQRNCSKFLCMRMCCYFSKKKSLQP